MKLLLALLMLVWPAATGAAEFPRGQLVGKVTEVTGAGTYALYLPSHYDPARAWPIVYVLDPRGRGAAAAEVFRPAAEAYGYILASSDNSASDTQGDPNFPAMKDLIRDTSDRFNIDKSRIYIAGYSGTARFAVSLARQSRPGLFAGILASGAGYPFGVAPRPSDSFPIYATVGDEDFNWAEMLRLPAALDKAGMTYFVDSFHGEHDWPPDAIARSAFGWFELQAMRRGTKPRDPDAIEAAWRGWSARAAAAEASGEWIAAHDLWAGAAKLFDGLRDTRPAAERAAAIAGDPRYARALAARGKLVARDETEMAEAREAFGMGRVEQALSFLSLEALNRKAKTAPTIEERASAKRVINHIAGQAGNYLVGPAIRARDWRQAIFFLTIAVNAKPDQPGYYYRRAAIYMKAGQRGQALADLKAAVARGFTNAAALDRDPAFAPLHGTDAFRQLVGSIGPAQG